MQSSAIAKLLEIASRPLSDGAPALGGLDQSIDVAELAALLSCRNGFYAFEGALHVYGSADTAGELGLVTWNSAGTWIQAYEGLADDRIFFAEDIFGGQFCVRKEGVFAFDPETARDEYIANDIEGWAQAVLVDFDVLLGFPLGHRWQQQNGPLQVGNRLIPRVPFVTGGEYEVSNLISMNAVKSMRLRAGLAVQLRDLPDGTTIEWEFSE